jgi:peptide-methionine (R)-S-oxide reductase
MTTAATLFLVALLWTRAASALSFHNNNNNNNNKNVETRHHSRKTTTTMMIPRRHVLVQTAMVVLATMPPVAAAADPKSRTDGYAVQHSEREWAYMLSGAQYNILRKGGTERQKSSILNENTITNVGTYVCAGCDTPLFSSGDKFNSGTGWPSFAAALEGAEVEDLNPIRATLSGREVRCHTCGGHLGDLFNDGMIYVGTAAAKTGKRYCIDGAALIFKPEDGGPEVMGDRPPPNKVIMYESRMYKQR